MNRADTNLGYSRQNFAAVFIAILMLVTLGVIGYSMLEGWHWLDALYFTFITISTVGYNELYPMHPVGRMFTIVMILLSLFVIAMLSASVTSFLVRKEFAETFKRKKLRNMIRSLKNHTILCGAGQTGGTVIEEFRAAKKPLVVVEDSQEVVAWLQSQYPDLPVISGDATKDDILQEANIEKAKGLITALSEDAANLYVVISARVLNPDLTIVARAVDAHAASKMYKAGATHVISPNLTEARRMAAVMLRPTVVSFLDVMMHDQELDLRLEEVAVSKKSTFVGRTLRDMQIPQKTGLIVIAVKKSGNGEPEFIYNPQSSTIIEAEDRLVVLGEAERVKTLEKLISLDYS